jgi:hypothetical protein
MLPAARDREASNRNSSLSPRIPTAPRAVIGAQPTPRSVTLSRRRPFRRIVIVTEPSALSRMAAETYFQRPKRMG